MLWRAVPESIESLSGGVKEVGDSCEGYEPTSARVRYVVIAAVVVVHAIELPIAIPYGMEAWWPMISSQTSLLAIYLGFGSGNRCLRGTLFSVGMIYLLANMMWAYSLMLNDISLYSMQWVDLVQMPSLLWLFPTILTVVAFVPIRALLGLIVHVPCYVTSRLRIVDLFVLTLVAALTISCFKVAMWRMEFTNEAILIGFKVACAVGCLLLVMSVRGWWAGALILAIGLYVQRNYSFATHFGGTLFWTEVVAPWLIVLATLACFRLLGYRLWRPVKASQSVVADGE